MNIPGISDGVMCSLTASMRDSEPADSMGMSKDPIVSIFLPVYNGRAYLGEAVHSLLTQSFADFELIIVDDGSTDESVKIAESLRKRDDRIRVIRGTHSG